MCSTYPLDQPESAAAARESADYGAFEVVVLDAEGNELGTLDRTFSNDFDATMAAREAEIPDISVTTEIRNAADETYNPGHQRHNRDPKRGRRNVLREPVLSIIPTQTVGAIDKTKRAAHWLDVQLGAQPESFYSSGEVKENLRQALEEVSNSARRELGMSTSRLSPLRASDLRGLYSSGVDEGELGFSSINGVHVVVCGEDGSERRRVPSVQVRGLGNLYTQFGVGGEEIEAVQTDCLGANPQTADAVAVDKQSK